MRLTERRRDARKRTELATRLYAAAAAQARQPAFYHAGVPDTFDGRFDLLVLHVFLVIRGLQREGETGAAAAQAVFDTLLDDMDRTLREMGVGDLGVPRRVKAMARAFYGRAAAYDAALDAVDDAGLRAALSRNLLDAAAASEPFCAYVRRADAALGQAPLLAGAASFPAPPGEEGNG